MAITYNPKIVTDGLALHLDFANPLCYRKNISSTWTEYSGGSANYVVQDTYDVLLKNTSNTWVGYFPMTVSSTGRYGIQFEYSSDTDGSSVVVDNDGAGDNLFNVSLTANKTPQTHFSVVSISATGECRVYIRRNSGGNILIKNFRLFNADVAYDLSGNGFTHTLINSPTFNLSEGSLTMGEGLSIRRTTAISTSTTQTVAIWYKTTDSQELWVMGNNSGAYYLSASASNNYYHGNAGSPTNYVDLSVTTRPDTPINYRNGAYHMWEAKNVNFSSWVQYDWFGYSPSWGLIGNVSKILVYDRILTSNESLQNFNAMKGRFGL